MRRHGICSSVHRCPRPTTFRRSRPWPHMTTTRHIPQPHGPARHVFFTNRGHSSIAPHIQHYLIYTSMTYICVCQSGSRCPLSTKAKKSAIFELHTSFHRLGSRPQLVTREDITPNAHSYPQRIRHYLATSHYSSLVLRSGSVLSLPCTNHIVMHAIQPQEAHLSHSRCDIVRSPRSSQVHDNRTSSAERHVPLPNTSLPDDMLISKHRSCFRLRNFR